MNSASREYQSSIDAWLNAGGIVVAASERAARALTAEFSRRRQAEGRSAWASPAIYDWLSFVRWAWSELSADGRLLLSRVQEQAVWADLAARDGRPSTLLEGPRFRIASMAMQAHELLCSYAPKYLNASARRSWLRDAGTFSKWLSDFDITCSAMNCLSMSRLPLELLSLLTELPEDQSRAPILIAGFDRLLPAQKSLLDAWGRWEQHESGVAAHDIAFFECAHEELELDACVRWCEQTLGADPDARILVVTQDAGKRRGEIERAFLRGSNGGHGPAFEFSLGVPLIQLPLPRAALLVLRWLSESLTETEIDWLFSTNELVADELESDALQAHILYLRNRGRQRPEWSLDEFLRSIGRRAVEESPLSDWAQKLREAKRTHDDLGRAQQTPLQWSNLCTQLLDTIRFATARPLSSNEFQSQKRWNQTLESVASLAFNDHRISWNEFLAALHRTLNETLFSPESEDAPILIAGPVESAGLTADAIWFLGATEDQWPARAASHPMIPDHVQREAHMPHATAELDWQLATTIARRLSQSAPAVRFSYARHVQGSESRPSRIVAELAGSCVPLPSEFIPQRTHHVLTTLHADTSTVPLTHTTMRSGATILSYQSQCPFKAFAAARLGARAWDVGEEGLTPIERGNLLHAVLHSIWGEQNGIRSHRELLAREDRESFVTQHIERAFKAAHRDLIDRMEDRYLSAERRRLARLITNWLEFEAARTPFEVLSVEDSKSISVAGLNFNVRLDRLDRLSDGSVLVVDYKTGDVSEKSWDLPRADDVQLPLYAGFALSTDQAAGGLVFAKLRPDESCFRGRVTNATSQLHPGLRSSSSLVKIPLTAQLLNDWRASIEQLARDFIDGRADVDPRNPPKTCDQCGFHTICRIRESQPLAIDDDSDEDGGDE